MAQRLSEIWIDPVADWKLESVDGEVDGKAVIGKVIGPFFVPNGVSRNERFYSRNFWEKVLVKEDVSDKLGRGVMFGTIGHDDRPITEDDLRKGEVSHIVKKLWIDDLGRGMGEAHILGTDSGKNLWIYLKAGSRLATSSRAQGNFKSGLKHKGMPEVDDESYVLETFDFVINPGFIEAVPSLRESLQKLDRGETMDMEKILEELSKSRDSLQRTVTSQMENIAGLQKEIATLNAANTQLKMSEGFAGVAKRLGALGSIDDLEDFMVVLKSNNSTIKESATLIPEALKNKTILENIESVKAAIKSLAVYEELGSVEEITQKIGASLVEGDVAILEKYKEIGDVETITEALEKAEALILQYKKIGSVSAITEALTKAAEHLEQYVELGSPEDIKTVFSESEEVLSVFTKLGSAVQIEEALSGAIKTIEQYSKLGTVEELAERLESSEKDAKSDLVKMYAEKYDLASSVVAEAIDGIQESKIDSVLKGLKASSSAMRFRMGESSEKVVTEQRVVGASRLQNFFEGFGRKNHTT